MKVWFPASTVPPFSGRSGSAACTTTARYCSLVSSDSAMTSTSPFLGFPGYVSSLSIGKLRVARNPTVDPPHLRVRNCLRSFAGLHNYGEPGCSTTPRPQRGTPLATSPYDMGNVCGYPQCHEVPLVHVHVISMIATRRNLFRNTVTPKRPKRWSPRPNCDVGTFSVGIQ